MKIYLKLTLLALFVFSFSSCTSDKRSQSEIAEGVLQTAYLSRPDTTQSSITPDDLRAETKLKNSQFVVIGLNLDGLGIDTIHEDITKLTSLEKLNLSNNNFTELPSFITKLTSLKELNLTNNAFKTLPVDLTQLNSLKKIILTGNEITTLPESLLVHLEYLDLGDNNLSEFPEYIWQASNLKTLHLQRNTIVEVPDKVLSFKELEELIVSNNKITGFPDILCNVHSLITLGISNNNIKVIPSEIANLSNLKTLYIRNCALKDLPIEITELKNLDWRGNPDDPGFSGIRISYNSICTPSPELAAWLNKYAEYTWKIKQACNE